jgi:hypothetical protein
MRNHEMVDLKIFEARNRASQFTMQHFLLECTNFHLKILKSQAYLLKK